MENLVKFVNVVTNKKDIVLIQQELGQIKNYQITGTLLNQLKKMVQSTKLIYHILILDFQTYVILNVELAGLNYHRPGMKTKLNCLVNQTNLKLLDHIKMKKDSGKLLNLTSMV